MRRSSVPALPVWLTEAGIPLRAVNNTMPLESRRRQAEFIPKEASLTRNQAAAGSAQPLQAVLLDTQALAEQQPELLVNTTPLGMHPQVASCPWPEGLPLPDNIFVYDLVYNPAMTVLVRKALSAGLRACTGLGMLVEQAALSLERWTGSPVPREAMWTAVQSLLPASLQGRYP